MAGSYRHATTVNGRLLNNESFVQVVENLGDAYETVEEMYGMIWWLAGQLAVIEDPAGQPAKPAIKAVVRDAERWYQEGLKIGGVERER